MPHRLAFLSTAHIHTRSFLQHLADRGLPPPLIWDDQPERGRDFAESFDAEFVTDRAALLDAEVDGFVICSDNADHLPLLAATLPLGKPIFCEKPLTATVADLDQLRGLLSRHASTPLCCGYFMPFSAAAVGLRQALADERLGRVTHVRHRNAHPGAYRGWFDSDALRWFTEPKRSGGGALLDLGTHSAHFLLSLFGPVDAVWACIANRSGRYPAVDDHGLLQLRFRSGLLGSIEAAWIHHGGRNGLEVFGEEGSLWQAEDGFQRRDPDGRRAPLATGTAEPDRMDRLLALITNPEAIDWQADLQHCIDAVRVIDAAYRSQQSGRWETLATDS